MAITFEEENLNR